MFPSSRSSSPNPFCQNKWSSILNRNIKLETVTVCDCMCVVCGVCSIKLYLSGEQVLRLHGGASAEPSVVQEYLSNPLLLDGFKFDCRLYVLLTGCDPLCVFLYPDGLVRLATELYQPPSPLNRVRPPSPSSLFSFLFSLFTYSHSHSDALSKTGTRGSCFSTFMFSFLSIIFGAKLIVF